MTVVRQAQAAEAVVAAGGGGQVREVDAGQLVLGVVAVARHPTAGLGGLGREIPVRVVDVGERVVLGEPVRRVGDVARREVRGRAVALGVVGVGFGRRRGATRG